MSSTQRLKTGRSSQFVDSGGGGSGGGHIVDAAGTTTDSFVSVLLNTAPAGLLGIGSILNTGSNSMDVKETAIDKFGNTVSVTTAVPAGDEYLLDLQTNFDDGSGPAMPPFVSYQVEVASTTAGNPTDYELHLIDVIPGSGSGGSSAGLQNAIISAAKTGPNIDFLSVGAGLSVDLLATATPFVCDVGGTHIIVAADTPITITDDENNFIWIDDTGAVGVSPLPCIYAYDEPTGATDQHWFDLGDNVMKAWNGSAFVETARIFIGYVRADSGTANARYACEPNLMTPSDRFNRFGDGSLGFLEVSAGTTTLPVGLRNYSAVVVRGTGVVTYADSDGQEAALQIMAQGIIAVLDTGAIDATGLGIPGAVATTGALGGSPGDGGGLGGAGGGGGGAAGRSGGDGGGHASGQRLPSVTTISAGVTLIVYWGGGAGGGAASDGSDGTGNGLSTGFSVPSLFGAGNGGGGGGGIGITTGAAGGAGGGVLLLSAASIAIGSGASVLADGDDGDAAGNVNTGGGGGGGGGTILAYSRVFQNDGTFTATGGTGGAGNTGGHQGGDGADGVALHIYN